MTGIRTVCVAVLLLGGLLLPSGQAGAQAGNDTPFVRFAPIVVTITENTRATGLLSVQYVIEGTDAGAREKLLQARARIEAEFRLVLARLASRRMRLNSVVNIDLIKQLLQARIDEILKPGMASVLIQTASIQPV